MEDATTATDTSTDNSSSVIENFDFSKPDGGLTETSEQGNSEDSTNATTDEADRPDKAVEDGEESRDTEQSASGDNDLSPEERNNQAAQRRIAAREAGHKADQEFASQLRGALKDEYVDVDPNEDEFEDMDPQVAEHIRQLRQRERANDAERALERISISRETTRLGVLQAEASIPMFNEADPDYNEKLHGIALSNYAHRYLEVRPGPDGVPQVVGTKEGAPSPLEYLQEQAKEFGEILKAERVNGQMAAQRNGARADVGSSNSSVRNSNSSEAIESRIGNIPLDQF